MIRLLILKLLVFPLVCLGQADDFPNLKKLMIGSNGHVATFGYDPITLKLVNIPCTKLPSDDFLFCENDEMEELYKLGDFEKDNQKYTVAFTFGISDDPEFMVIKNRKVIGRIYSRNLYLNSNGIAYSSGHTNNMFDKKRKFEIQKDSLIEVIQPFYYVGLKTVTTDQIKLYSSSESKEVVAIIPKDYEIEVLLAEYGKKGMESESLFLIKTKFGLTGWINVPEVYNSRIKGLFFAGD